VGEVADEVPVEVDKAEELLDLAASAFVQAAVITWTGGNIGPLIRTPIIE
jgi:hypothetical protein